MNCRKCRSNNTYDVYEMGVHSLACRTCGERDYSVFVTTKNQRVVIDRQNKRFYQRREA